MDAFISYQRKSSAMLATLLHEKLKNDYKLNVFVDTRRTDGSSAPFPKTILDAINASSVFVCLLGERTLESDWVKTEIQQAYHLSKPCIPVLQEGFTPPINPSDAVEYLLNFDGVRILDQQNIYIDDAVEKLAHLIKPQDEKPVISCLQLLFWGIGLLITIFLVGIGIWWILNSNASSLETDSQTHTPSPSNPASPSFTPSFTPSPTFTPSFTPSLTATPTFTPSFTPSFTPTATFTPSSTEIGPCTLTVTSTNGVYIRSYPVYGNIRIGLPAESNRSVQGQMENTDSGTWYRVTEGWVIGSGVTLSGDCTEIQSELYIAPTATALPTLSGPATIEIVDISVGATTTNGCTATVYLRVTGVVRGNFWVRNDSGDYNYPPAVFNGTGEYRYGVNLGGVGQTHYIRFEGDEGYPSTGEISRTCS